MYIQKNDIQNNTISVQSKQKPFIQMYKDVINNLMKNDAFMKEWRKNFGRKSPVTYLKNTGNLKLINIVNERII